MYRKEFKDGSNSDHVMIQLGDCLDRGPQNLESFLYSLAWKLVYPKQFYFVRGNHESGSMTRKYGAQKEIIMKYSRHIYKLIIKCCTYLPVAAVVNDTYWCAHGGIPYFENGYPPYIVDLNKDNRFCEPRKMSVVLQNILWADPAHNFEQNFEHLFEDSQRGEDIYYFTALAVHQFLVKNGLQEIIRGHEFYYEGYKIFHDHLGQILIRSIFSSPNYSGREKNPGSALQIRGTVPLKIVLYPPNGNGPELPPSVTLWEFILPVVLSTYFEFGAQFLKYRHKLPELFQTLDKNGNAKLDGREIMHQLNLDDEGMVNRMIYIHDTDDDGTISMEELEQMCSNFCKERVSIIFKFIDEDLDGEITVKDLVECVKRISKSMQLPLNCLEEKNCSTLEALALQTIHVLTNKNYVDYEDFDKVFSILGYTKG
ncbi:serine/threonine-protein phosphatase PP1-like [Artemia franciscana]